VQDDDWRRRPQLHCSARGDLRVPVANSRRA
jgi:hypothetical protein